VPSKPVRRKNKNQVSDESVASRRTGVHEVGQAGRSDLEQLRYATREGRWLVTRNVADFLELVRQLINRQESHGGIILVPARFRGEPFAALADAIAGCVATSPEGLADQVLFLRRPLR
jgi:Domain of unknown function (DUF5615)